MFIICATCEHEIEDDPHDTTYSNCTSGRVQAGTLTGEIYKRPECEDYTIDDYLNNCVRSWSY